MSPPLVVQRALQRGQQVQLLQAPHSVRHQRRWFSLVLTQLMVGFFPSIASLQSTCGDIRAAEGPSRLTGVLNQRPQPEAEVHAAAPRSVPQMLGSQRPPHKRQQMSDLKLSLLISLKHLTPPPSSVYEEQLTDARWGGTSGRTSGTRLTH